MTTLEIIFWVCALVVFYSYIGYGIVLYAMVKVKELFCKPRRREFPYKGAEAGNAPEVTLLIAAYNEELVVKDKMANTRALRYPEGRLRIVWVTDGTTDRTNELLGEYPEVTVLFDPRRGGKAAAFNRAMPFISTPLTVYTDANTMLNPEAIEEIVTSFEDPKVGCVAGEKRIVAEGPVDSAAGEGIYWKYESTLKDLDSRLYSAVGAAGELFAIRTPLFVALPEDTLLDDFILSLEIARGGYKIAYCPGAYAVEPPSANIKEEAKRKVRISAGGLQSIWRLRPLLNIFRYGTLSFQYVSHRVLRWSLAPLALFALLLLNIALVAVGTRPELYITLLILQVLFYVAGICGGKVAAKGIVGKLLLIPYYFLFMNVNVVRGAFYLYRNKGRGTWEKAKRSGS